MKLLSDLLPLIAFFAAWQITGDIFLATGILMASMTLQIAIMYMKGNAIDPIMKGSYILVIIFGALTFLFESEEFIQWKPSILYFGLAVTLLAFLTVSKQNPLQKLFLPIFEKANLELKANSSSWKKLSYLWVFGFTLLGLANIYVANNFDLDTWVSFKTFVIPIVSSVYLFGTLGFLIARGAKQDNSPAPPKD